MKTEINPWNCVGGKFLKTFVREMFTNVLSPIMSYLTSANPRIRFTAAKILSKFANQCPAFIIEIILDPLLKLMEADGHHLGRKGAVETVYQIMNILQDKIIVFTILFIVPVLRLMSDRDQPTRQLAAQTFGKLIQLMPLGGIANAF